MAEGVQDHLERAFAARAGRAAAGARRGPHRFRRARAGADRARRRAARAGSRCGSGRSALNAHLRRASACCGSHARAPDFHARFDAKGKIYTYRVWNHHALHPLEIGRAWFVPGAIDQTTLLAAARLFEGTHDFAAFAANRGQSETRHGTDTARIRVSRRGALLTLRFRGNGFLYRMVRLLTGTQSGALLGAAPACLDAGTPAGARGQKDPLLRAGGGALSHARALLSRRRSRRSSRRDTTFRGYFDRVLIVLEIQVAEIAKVMNQLGEGNIPQLQRDRFQLHVFGQIHDKVHRLFTITRFGYGLAEGLDCGADGGILKLHLRNDQRRELLLLVIALRRLRFLDFDHAQVVDRNLIARVGLDHGLKALLRRLHVAANEGGLRVGHHCCWVAWACRARRKEQARRKRPGGEISCVAVCPESAGKSTFHAAFLCRVLVPLVAAFVYAFAALTLKRATERHGPVARQFRGQLGQALVFAPVYFLGSAPFSTGHFSHAVLNGRSFFAGQIFTFLALSRGDVSVATPVLGTKVIFVALLTVLVTHQPIPAVWWARRCSPRRRADGRRRPGAPGQATFRRSLVYGFSAAFCFSLTDVLSQKWAPAWGFAQFAPAMFLTVGVCSLGLIPFFPAPLTSLSSETWRWLLAGSLLLGMQAGCVAVSIMTFGQATLMNILYSSRGLWTVVLVWVTGHWFGKRSAGTGMGDDAAAPRRGAVAGGGGAGGAVKPRENHRL